MNRLAVLHDMECICCEMERHFSISRGEAPIGQPMKTEAHHLVDKGSREASGGDEASIPLCGWHHRAGMPYTMRAYEMTNLHGPSLARSKRNFIALYGTERSLLERTNEKLKHRAAA